MDCTVFIELCADDELRESVLICLTIVTSSLLNHVRVLPHTPVLCLCVLTHRQVDQCCVLCFEIYIEC